MQHRLLNNHSDPTDLIIYFAGWGTPPELVADWAHPSFCDLLLCWDYRDLTLDIDLSPYAHVHVLAWSLGVWAAENSLPKLAIASATAINGTLQPIDDTLGIPTAIFSGTLDGLQGKFAARTRDKFELRMVGDAARLATYRQLPQRNLGDITAELQAVHTTATQHIPTTPNIAWQRAIIGEKDAIFPPDNQYRYWHHHAPNCHIDSLSAPHEALSQYDDFSALLDGLNA